MDRVSCSIERRDVFLAQEMDVYGLGLRGDDAVRAELRRLSPRRPMLGGSAVCAGVRRIFHRLQAEWIETARRIRREHGRGRILLSHDWCCSDGRVDYRWSNAQAV